MIEKRMRDLLAERPYLGSKTLASLLGTSPSVIRVTATRAKIRLMDRYAVEAFLDSLVHTIRALEQNTAVKTKTSAGEPADGEEIDGV